MRRIIALTVIALSLVAGNAMAESINGRLGLNGKAGFIVPLKDGTINNSTFWTDDVGFAGGGGIIYGIGDYFAVEANFIYVPSMDVKMGNNIKVDELSLSDYSLGVQYRILPKERWVPYIGGGADFINGSIGGSDVDWTYGGYVNGGVDFFINKSIVFNVDCKVIIAEKSDILQNNVKIGSFDPTSVVTTFGFRLFLPDNW